MAQATQAAAITGAQATLAATEASGMAVGAASIADAAGFLAGVFSGLAISNSRLR